MMRLDVVTHLDWADRVAVGTWRLLPRVIDYEDACGIGRIALVEAGTRYRPETGVPFRAYANVRISGAVRDAVRSQSASVRRIASRVKPPPAPVSFVSLSDHEDGFASDADAGRHAREARQDIERLMRRTSLSALDRAVVRALLGGMLQVEIARRLQRTEGAITVRLRRITRELRAATRCGDRSTT